MPLHRRACLRALPAWLSLSWWLHARARGKPVTPANLPPLRSCIFLFWYGGPSQLDTFDPKPNAPAEIRGEFRPITSSVPGIHNSEHLPNLARVMHHCAMIRSMHHGNRLHDSASIETFTGRKPPLGDVELFQPMPQVFPSIGSAVTYASASRSSGSHALRHAALPCWFRNVHDVPCQGAGMLGPRFDPLLIEVDPITQRYAAGLLNLPPELGSSRRRNREILRLSMDAIHGTATQPAALTDHYRRAHELLDTAAVRRALELEREDPRSRERYGIYAYSEPGGSARSDHAYGRNMRGQNLLLARRLVEAGVPFIDVHDFRQQGQNWDTHADNFTQHREILLPPTDRALATLIEDLQARGLLDSTLIVATGEFGRTPRINAQAGRDHWPDCYSVLLAGGGVRGGAVWGASDRFAASPAQDPVTPADLTATILWRFGIDPATQIRDGLNRPFALSEGRPILALFS
jgi:hypothetical protein